jgi:hypothetical protein
MDVREKLVEILRKPIFPHELVDPIEAVADYLLDSGITLRELDGCEYCKEDNEGFRRMFGAFSLVNPLHGKTWQIHAGKCKPREINFCPMCGRRLPQPPKGE